ncbi:MAG: hypothetical protein GY696_04290, partial [Gammaproteobacteria bacterium]|nr:hypothetical protein [Gammaproteobacteria bacterium]
MERLEDQVRDQAREIEELKAVFQPYAVFGENMRKAMIQNEHQAGVSVSAFSQVPFPEDPKPVVTKTFLADGSGRMLIGQ